MLNLVLARGYVAKLVDNKSVFRYLVCNHGPVLAQLVGLVNSPRQIFEVSESVGLHGMFRRHQVHIDPA